MHTQIKESYSKKQSSMRTRSPRDEDGKNSYIGKHLLCDYITVFPMADDIRSDIQSPLECIDYQEDE
ncbi:hypothetical protein CC2G_010333 [Coprinopsis cinerea AmutBmut pab1-1]|nr:hypothetical protein CC2G_010333 [Coprinopsis cinerea AmutBmut pab1-1]